MRNFAELMINGTSGLSSALVEADKAASIADVTAYTDDSCTYVMEFCRTPTGTNPEARDLEAAKNITVIVIPRTVCARIIVHARFRREEIVRVDLSPITSHAERGRPSLSTSTITPM